MVRLLKGKLVLKNLTSFEKCMASNERDMPGAYGVCKEEEANSGQLAAHWTEDCYLLLWPLL